MMAVVSAGSLCAGSRDLPRGIDRQYNIITIDDDYLGAKLYVREMRGGRQFGRSTRGILGISGFVSLKWERPANAVGHTVDPRQNHERESLLRAEAEMRGGDFASAEKTIFGIASPSNSYARALRLQIARSLKQWTQIIEITRDPSTPDELVLLTEAHLELKQFSAAQSVLNAHAKNLALANHIIRELTEKIQLGQMMKGSD